MSAGKCNLLLIKTCCWHRLQTDNDLRLSFSHFSSALLSSYFSSVAPPTLAPSSFSRYLNIQLFPLTSYFLPPYNLLHLTFCFLFLFSISLLPCQLFLLHCSPSTMKRKREPSAGKSSSSTITSWRRRSPSINSERTMWVLKGASCNKGSHWPLCQHCACRLTCIIGGMPELYFTFKPTN